MIKTLTKIELLLAVLVGILSPTIAGVASYVKSNGEIERKMEVLRTERETNFVRKDAFRDMSYKVDRIAEDMAEIKGYLKQRH